jgi:hypothetical protein
MLQIGPGFFKDKRKLFVVAKKIWKRTRTKAFGPNFSSTVRKRFVSIQNFVSKRIYSIFIGTKAAKGKLSIVKERWFDIASLHWRGLGFSWRCLHHSTGTQIATAPGPVLTTESFAAARCLYFTGA